MGLSTMVLDVGLGSDPDAVDTAETLGEAATDTSIDPDTVPGASVGVGTNPVAFESVLHRPLATKSRPRILVGWRQCVPRKR